MEQKALEKRKKMLGEDHLDAILAISSLAVTLTDLTNERRQC
jgi:hypothetical protein